MGPNVLLNLQNVERAYRTGMGPTHPCPFPACVKNGTLKNPTQIQSHILMSTTDCCNSDEHHIQVIVEFCQLGVFSLCFCLIKQISFKWPGTSLALQVLKYTYYKSLSGERMRALPEFCHLQDQNIRQIEMHHSLTLAHLVQTKPVIYGCVSVTCDGPDNSQNLIWTIPSSF